MTGSSLNSSVLNDSLISQATSSTEIESYPSHSVNKLTFYVAISYILYVDGSVAEWLACWTQEVQKGPGSNRSRDAVG